VGMVSPTGSARQGRFANFREGLRSDISTWSLLGSNAVVIIYALAEGWNILTLMWIYWAQSVIIGCVNFIRILSLRDFSTEGVRMSGKPVEATGAAKVAIALFFLFHYGFFHLGYAVFLSSGMFSGKSAPPIDRSYILMTSAVFLGNHVFSFLYNRERDRVKQNIGRVMAFPYARIIPMHLTIIFGSFLGGHAIVLFLLLKTLADVIMHGVEHQVKEAS